MSKGKKIKSIYSTDVCEVEKYTDGNTRKKKVFFCPDCQAFMCNKCSGNVVKRFMAMINRDLDKKLKL